MVGYVGNSPPSTASFRLVKYFKSLRKGLVTGTSAGNGPKTPHIRCFPAEFPVRHPFETEALSEFRWNPGSKDKIVFFF